MIFPSPFWGCIALTWGFLLFFLYNVSSLNWIPVPSSFLSCTFLVSQSIHILPGWQCPGGQAASAQKPHHCPMARPTLPSLLFAPVWLRMVLGWWPCAGSFLPNCKSLRRVFGRSLLFLWSISLVCQDWSKCPLSPVCLQRCSSWCCLQTYCFAQVR